MIQLVFFSFLTSSYVSLVFPPKANVVPLATLSIVRKTTHYTAISVTMSQLYANRRLQI